MGPKCVFLNLTGMSLRGSRDNPARSVVQKGWKNSNLLSGKACCTGMQSIDIADFFRFTLSFLCIKFFTRMRYCSSIFVQHLQHGTVHAKRKVVSPLPSELAGFWDMSL